MPKKEPAEQGNLMARLGRIFDKITYSLAVACGALYIFLLVSVTVAVLSRNIFVRPMAWTIEISEYILLYTTFLGAAWLLTNDAHVKVDILVNRLNARQQKMLRYVSTAIQIFVSSVLLYFGTMTTLELFIKHIPVIKVLAIPKFIIVAVIPVGCLFILVQSIRTRGFSSSGTGMH